jgi:hypothetical protein
MKGRRSSADGSRKNESRSSPRKRELKGIWRASRFGRIAEGSKSKPILPFFRTVRYDARTDEAGLSAEAAIFALRAKRREQAKRNGDQTLENTRLREIIDFAGQ